MACLHLNIYVYCKTSIELV